MTSTENKTQPRLKLRYRAEIKDALNAEFEYANVMQIPGVVKVVVNMGVGDAARDAKLINGAVAVRHPAWSNPAGDPLRLLVWLANEGALSLGGLRAGQWVTTGSCTGTVLVARGTAVVADFPALGRAELLIT